MIDIFLPLWYDIHGSEIVHIINIFVYGGFML